MEYWDKCPLPRDQILLISRTLDESVSDDHPVRVLDEMLRALDWSAWELEYDGARGRPPIPPWVMAGAILYGIMRRIRSSRQLEYACGNNVDFMWLVEGRTIDHDTFCKFRTKFKKALKELFKQIGRLSMQMGFIKLVEIAFDGTRVKANASRYRTWTAERLEAAIAELEKGAEAMLSESEANDAEEAKLRDPDAAGLPPDLADVKQRKAKLQELLAQAREADAARKKVGLKSPAQIPKADPDSNVMPNKEGGYAPNYTPFVASDGAQGLIVDCGVIGSPNEHKELLPSIDHIEEDLGQKPENVSADKAFGTGHNLQGMEARGVNFLTPMESPESQEGNPAKREDPRQAVAEEDWSKLPRSDKKKLDKSCFIYDAATDKYFCPLGKEMPYRSTKREQIPQGERVIRVYGCNDCAACPLAKECLDPSARRGRTINRDEHEPARMRMHAKMQTEEARNTYARRMHIGETPFAIIKNIFDVRRFLLRGLEKVETEWCWVCTAFNVKKIIVLVGQMRANGAMTEKIARG
jgi:transposase